jgi:hypothetical protein
MSAEAGSTEELNFRRQHNGMTRAEWAEKVRPFSAHDESDEVHTFDLEGEPPDGICNARGLSPQRARLARYHAWRMQEERKQSDLQTLKAKMQSIIDVPAATEAEIKREVKRTASFLMGREPTDGADIAKRRRLDDRLASERHAAEAAREALAEIERKTKIGELRLSRLNRRESEFVHPALIEVAEELGLGKLYLKKIAELREVTEIIFGLSKVTGKGSGVACQMHGERPLRDAEAVSFPRNVLPSMAKTESHECTITSHGRPEVWTQLHQAILLNPGMDASKFVALPR